MSSNVVVNIFPDHGQTGLKQGPCHKRSLLGDYIDFVLGFPTCEDCTIKVQVRKLNPSVARIEVKIELDAGGPADCSTVVTDPNPISLPFDAEAFMSTCEDCEGETYRVYARAYILNNGTYQFVEEISRPVTC